MSTLPLRLVVSALPIFTPSLEVGVTLPSLFALATRSLARSSRSATRSQTAKSATEVRPVHSSICKQTMLTTIQSVLVLRLVPT